MVRKTFFCRNTDVFQGKMALTQREKVRCPGALAVGRIHPSIADAMALHKSGSVVNFW